MSFHVEVDQVSNIHGSTSTWNIKGIGPILNCCMAIVKIIHLCILALGIILTVNERPGTSKYLHYNKILQTHSIFYETDFI